MKSFWEWFVFFCCLRNIFIEKNLFLNLFQKICLFSSLFSNKLQQSGLLLFFFF